MKRFTVFPKLTPLLIASLAILFALAYLLGLYSIPIIPKQLVFSFTFIINTIIGMIAGPWLSFVSLGLFDIFDTLLSSAASQFNIVWTLMEAFLGFLYGAFFYQKRLSWSSKKDWLYVFGAVTVIAIIQSFILTPLLLQWMYGTPYLAQLVAGRWLKIFEIPLRLIITMAILPQLQRIPELRKLMGISK